MLSNKFGSIMTCIEDIQMQFISEILRRDCWKHNVPFRYYFCYSLVSRNWQHVLRWELKLFQDSLRGIEEAPIHRPHLLSEGVYRPPIPHGAALLIATSSFSTCLGSWQYFVLYICTLRLPGEQVTHVLVWEELSAPCANWRWIGWKLIRWKLITVDSWMSKNFGMEISHSYIYRELSDFQSSEEHLCVGHDDTAKSLYDFCSNRPSRVDYWEVHVSPVSVDISRSTHLQGVM